MSDVSVILFHADLSQYLFDYPFYHPPTVLQSILADTNIAQGSFGWLFLTRPTPSLIFYMLLSRVGNSLSLL